MIIEHTEVEGQSQKDKGVGVLNYWRHWLKFVSSKKEIKDSFHFCPFQQRLS